jgi:hypothetical protein
VLGHRELLLVQSLVPHRVEHKFEPVWCPASHAVGLRAR